MIVFEKGKIFDGKNNENMMNTFDYIPSKDKGFSLT